MEQAAGAPAQASPETRWQLPGPVRPHAVDLDVSPGPGAQLPFLTHLRAVDHAHATCLLVERADWYDFLPPGMAVPPRPPVVNCRFRRPPRRRASPQEWRLCRRRSD